MLEQIPEIKNTVNEDYGPITITDSNFERSPLEFHLSSIYSKLIQTEKGKEVVQEIDKDLRMQKFKGKKISKFIGGGLGVPGTIGTDNIAMWFFWYANKYGNDFAIKNLNEFLDGDEVGVEVTLWLLGIIVYNKMELTKDYKIVPINDMPASSDKQDFIQAERRKSHPKFPSPKCAITLARNRCDINSYFHSIKTLEEISLILNALDNISCLPYYSTTYLDNNTPPGPFISDGCLVGTMPYYHDVIGSRISVLTDDRVAELNELIDSYFALSEKGKTQFFHVLTRLSQAKRRERIEDKILELAIALEMMLLSGKEKDQLALSFRLRGSWLLAEDVNKRIEIFDDLKNIYNYRSRMAHNGFLSPKEVTSVRNSFQRYQLLTEKICRRLLIKGIPDWDRLILGS